MNWNNVKLIYLRELRDQLRDRRTLFTIAVLPLLLYPLLGMAMLQMQQFLKNDSRIRLIGAVTLPAESPLIRDNQFLQKLYPGDAKQLILTVDPEDAPNAELEQIRATAEQDIRDGKYDLVVYFPPDFSATLREFRRELLRDRPADGPADDTFATLGEVPGPEIIANLAVDRSVVAHGRVASILQQWRESIVGENLRQSRLPAAAVRPFEVVSHDVAHENARSVMLWSKLLPFVLLIWALTGAFYPAIDLCAGEKERGTLETLLSSAAQRSEIVWGKLFTIMSFSMATALLNLASLGVTGLFVAPVLSKMGPDLGSPPLAAVGWLILALVPIAALFSALSLAIAAFARSSKEGQYYLMPLLLCALPLMTLSLLPSVELNIGFSLIPITGVMLLLRTLIEGQYWEALRFLPLVTGVTGACCLLAIRWATDQFNSESVMFREGERLDVRMWMQHLIRDRGDTPTVGQALLCGVLLLVIRFFASFSMRQPESWSQVAASVMTLQIGLILAPACLMAIMLTRRPLQTLLLRRPSFLATAPAAALLAVLLHPAMMQLSYLVQYIYPVNETIADSLKGFTDLFTSAPLWQVLLVVAVTPAICEELAFRGFILSGFRKLGHKWAAIVLCSVFFGLLHSLVQQSLTACFVGIVIGYVAVKTGSLLPAALYHMTHNGLTVIESRLTSDLLQASPLARLVWAPGDEGLSYTLPATIVMAALGVGLLLWFKSLPYRASDEERLQEVLDRQPTLAAATASMKRLA